MLPTARLINELQEARARLLELVADLDDEQMIGPRLAIVNPLRWEIAHIAWFQEFWNLRHLRGLEPVKAHSPWHPDKLYDSARVAHDTRWDLPLPSKRDTLGYLQQILYRVLEEADKTLGQPLSDARGFAEAYFLQLALGHEDMHSEAITYTRQTLGYSAPQVGSSTFRQSTPTAEKPPEVGTTNTPGDAYIPGGTFLLGSNPEDGFVFDNEQWAHAVTIAPFAIARTATSNAEFAEFVNAGGYQQRDLWSDAGWQWRMNENAQHPVYWKSSGEGQWLRRVFDQWLPLENDLPVLHVNWYEAEAYCRSRQRRLPSEAEWELAACGEPAADGRGITERKRRFPWGDEPPTPERANLDWRALQQGCLLPVQALPAGDSAFGCRQMIGTVWEWTASDFQPYPGFAPGQYKEYSAPWFGDHKVLRGGCWATRSRLIRGSYRNFYKPERRDVWAGFRTCAF